ncbi:hypothetical protein [Paraburkholderia sp. D1E]|uniref:hypothetical protein n=1 Tax=Paraburkholderia sp. D1E TaxID=3461398 RepID=UPI004045D58E
MWRGENRFVVFNPDFNVGVLTQDRRSTMSTVVSHRKIPKNVRVNGTGKDAVAPTVKGIRTIIPSTLGIADRARFGKYVKAADSLVHGLDAIIKIRNSDEAQADPELKALANDPRLAKAIDKAISKLAAGVDSLVREYNETATDDPEALVTGQITGQDGAWRAFDAATIQLREQAAKRASELRHAANAVNPARVALGLADDVDLDPIGTMQKLFGK